MTTYFKFREYLRVEPFCLDFNDETNEVMVSLFDLKPARITYSVMDRIDQM